MLEIVGEALRFEWVLEGADCDAHGGGGLLGFEVGYDETVDLVAEADGVVEALVALALDDVAQNLHLC